MWETPTQGKHPPVKQQFPWLGKIWLFSGTDGDGTLSGFSRIRVGIHPDPANGVSYCFLRGNPYNPPLPLK